MPRAERSIVVRGDIDTIFAVTNDIERWPELFVEYGKARVLSFKREGRFARIDFELTSAEGQTWQSWRLLDYENHIAVAQRGTPMFPFSYMHITWRYETVDEGVRMTWIQDFEADPKAPLNNEQAVVYMLEHMGKNQAQFKKVLEAAPQAKSL
ncbi:MAG TPA: SRPBCC family protein [Ktedonobacteraceae bacterium]|jgi:aromatase